MSSIEQLREEIRNTKTIDDIIEAIFYKVRVTINDFIPKSQVFLQRTFFQLKKESPQLFKGFIFDESGVTPFSDELDSVLFRLEASTIFATLNPTYKNYNITDDALELLKTSYEKLESERVEIDKCATIFCKLVEDQKKHQAA